MINLEPSCLRTSNIYNLSLTNDQIHIFLADAIKSVGDAWHFM